jgi:hypothetical protein
MYETTSHNSSLGAILEVTRCIVAADGLYLNGIEQKQNLKAACLLNGKQVRAIKLSLVNCTEESLLQAVLL